MLDFVSLRQLIYLDGDGRCKWYLFTAPYMRKWPKKSVFRSCPLTFTTKRLIICNHFCQLQNDLQSCNINLTNIKFLLQSVYNVPHSSSNLLCCRFTSRGPFFMPGGGAPLITS